MPASMFDKKPDSIFDKKFGDSENQSAEKKAIDADTDNLPGGLELSDGPGDNQENAEEAENIRQH